MSTTIFYETFQMCNNVAIAVLLLDFLLTFQWNFVHIVLIFLHCLFSFKILTIKNTNLLNTFRLLVSVVMYIGCNTTMCCVIDKRKIIHSWIFAQLNFLTLVLIGYYKIKNTFG